MKFGRLDNTTEVDFTIPATVQETLDILGDHKNQSPLEVYVGCAKWNRNDLKGFYPRGTKDELHYYSSQFNTIEMNATFYHSPSKEQVEKWLDKVPKEFRFCPKIPQSISHYSRLLQANEKVEQFVDAVVLFEENLGTAFLQMPENFQPKHIDRLKAFLHDFPKACPLAVEVRHPDWFLEDIFAQYCTLLESRQMSNVLLDTPGRRDMLHMRLTNPVAFVRFLAANQPLDYSRLDNWVDIIASWKEAGLKQLYFFIHQDLKLETPLLASYFNEKLNERLGMSLYIPTKVSV